MAAVIGGFTLLFLTDPRYSAAGAGEDIKMLHAFGWAVVILCAFIIILGIGAWLRRHLVIAAMLAGAACIFGTWIERWNIVVPTLTSSTHDCL